MKWIFCALFLAAPCCGAARQWGPSHQVRFVLDDPIDHPLYWWPRTLLSYPVEFAEPVDLGQLALKRKDTGETTPVQFSNIVREGERVRSATVNFFADLPAGGHREFILEPGKPALAEGVRETREGAGVILDSGSLRVRIPATQTVEGAAPGPLRQFSRGGQWFGESTLSIPGERIARIDAVRTETGPLFITYRLTYTTEKGGKYIATIRCAAGQDFVRLREDMEGIAGKGEWKLAWTGLPVSFRQSVDHPYPFPNLAGKEWNYDDLPWEPVAMKQTNTHLGVLPGIAADGELPFALGAYEPWSAFRTATFANFWSTASSDAVGLFIDKVGDWQDHDYAIWHASPRLQVKFYYDGKTLSWKWPVERGARSSCITVYDHAKDRDAMERLEETGSRSPTSYALFLQNRYGTLDLNEVKDWVLTAEAAPKPIFRTGLIRNAAELERRVMNSDLATQLPVTGTRQNGGFGPTASRQIQDWWIDGFSRLYSQMNEKQRRRLTGMFLLMAYVHAGEDYMPMLPMLSGHPNFLSDVKSVPASLAFLFPKHPMAGSWADEFQTYFRLNTRYHTRPPVAEWDSKGGRWTENLGTYVWGFLRPALRADFLLKQFDSNSRIATPQIAEVGNWLVDALSAPFDGEPPAIVNTAEFKRDRHEWGVVMPGSGPRRVYPPMGAHSERRIPPRALWYLGRALDRYDPLAAERLMWAARPTDQDMETPREEPDPWAAAYENAGNSGTDPHLRSSKYTGFGITLRAAVGTRDELSVHLQQIDDGPNYRWGVAADGGTGVLYFYAGGKSYSYNGSEDVGDRVAQDTDFCTNFGVWKDNYFHSIGKNVLSRPMYDLKLAQYAELTPRAYSAPEYVSRSVMLAGNDYFVLYDDVFNESVGHRLSWFVRNGEELPSIMIARPRQVQVTEVKTLATNGKWFDGLGDSLVVVSNRNGLRTEATAFGARVRGDGVDDLVFRDPDGVHYQAGGIGFDGTAGLVRARGGHYEAALFHGKRIAVPGFSLETEDTDLGFSVDVAAMSGEYYAPKASHARLQPANVPFYVDGALSNGELPPGRHHWQMTAGLPVPLAPEILRTENRAGGAVIIVKPVQAAERYRFELSRDGGKTWTPAGASLGGLANGSKVHVRAIAENREHTSEPGPEYPVYITDQPPLPPDGLQASGNALSWGEVLGASEYRLYGGNGGQFQLLTHGLERTFQMRSPAMDYKVSAVNGNGEGPASRVVNPSQAWDPRPGEPFRRTGVASGRASDYYPK